MNKTFCDQDMMKDLLSSQKFISDNYNSCANECATPAVHTDFMNILRDEHQIQNDVFCEMQTRGWYPTEAADQNKVTKAKQKYSGQ
jgi:spore coat protein CotF